MNHRNTMTLLLVAFALAGLVLTGCGKADNGEKPDPEGKTPETKEPAPKDVDASKDPYGAFGVGTTWTTRQVTTMSAMPGGGTTVTVTSTIIAKTDEVVTVEQATTTMGQTNKQTLKMERGMDDAGPVKPQGEKLNSGTETITVPAGTFECEWIEMKFESPAGTQRTRMWSCGKVPGLIVKMVTSVEGPASMETTLELQSLETK